LDAGKSRLLEVPPFALQQLLAGQAHGAPAATLVGRRDVFARRAEPPAPPPARPGAERRPARPASDPQINAFLQAELARRDLARVTAVEANAWLDAAGLLWDSAIHPGLPLRELLRAGRIANARQGVNSRWSIERRPAGAG